MVRRSILVLMTAALLVAACSDAPDSIPPTPAGAGGASAGKGGANAAGKGGSGGKAGSGDDGGVDADGGKE